MIIIILLSYYYFFFLFPTPYSVIRARVSNGQADLARDRDFLYTRARGPKKKGRSNLRSEPSGIHRYVHVLPRPLEANRRRARIGYFAEITRGLRGGRG